MTDSPLQRHSQANAYASPWSPGVRVRVALWRVVCLVLFRPTPKPCNRWRVFLLRLFGAQITGRPFVMASARIWAPWNLRLEDHACLGAHCDVYNLAPITVGAHATVAQQVYLCAGSHDFASEQLDLVTGPIVIGARAFVALRAIVLPGVEIGEGCVIGAGSVVTRDQPSWSICAGNPCRILKPRTRDTTVEAT